MTKQAVILQSCPTEKVCMPQQLAAIAAAEAAGAAAAAAAGLRSGSAVTCLCTRLQLQADMYFNLYLLQQLRDSGTHISPGNSFLDASVSSSQHDRLILHILRTQLQSNWNSLKQPGKCISETHDI